jgi:hypothetical protein
VFAALDSLDQIDLFSHDYRERLTRHPEHPPPVPDPNTNGEILMEFDVFTYARHTHASYIE